MTPVTTVDLVVVGSGAAGLAAACTAATDGLDVLVVEKAAVLGGTTVKSGGVYWVPGNHLQREVGIDDGLDRALPYMARVAAPGRYDPDNPMLGLTEWEHELLSAYPALVAEVVERFDRTGALRSTIELALRFPDYHMELPEQGGIYGRALCPMGPDGQPAKGDELIAQLVRAATAAGAQIRTETALADLVVRNGRVSGAVLADGSVVDARAGVVLAAGGFTHDADRRARHLPARTWGGCASPGNTGDALPVLERLGVPLHALDTAWWDQVAIEHTIHGTTETRAGVWVAPGDSSIIVDRRGVRIVNEKQPYNERAKVHLAQDAPEALFLVYDQRTADLFSAESFAYPLPGDGESSDHVVTGQTWGDLVDRLRERLAALRDVLVLELADDFGDNLVATVDRFDRFATAGLDLDFGRGGQPIEAHFTGVPRAGCGPSSTMAPFAGDGPYHAIVIGLGTLDTKGGPRTNRHGQVLGADDAPVPGLYAAGNCAASPTGQGYWAAGATIGPALAFGSAAARHAAAALGIARTELASDVLPA